MFPPTEPTRANITIFDWDDTLFPTYQLARRNSLQQTLLFLENSPSAAEQLRKIEEAVISCFEEALRHGQVFVITNSQQGWVEMSAALLYPNVVPLLRSRIQVISARKMYSSKTPSPLLWKKMAFSKLLQKTEHFYGKDAYSVVSIGDSWEDRESLNCACIPTKAIPKSIKFLDIPSLSSIKSQLNLLQVQLKNIHLNKAALDLMVRSVEGGHCFVDLSPSAYTHKQAV